MHRKNICGALVAVFCVNSGTQATAEVVAGIPRIQDADTVTVAGKSIRLAGIDAPETHPQQICLDAKGAYWRCGIAAREALVAFAAGKEWRCELTGRSWKRRVGSCFVGNVDIQRWLVRHGWALDYKRFSRGAFAAEEAAARAARLGLWSGAFHAPWNWRHRTCNTTILGAYSVPIDAREKLCRPPPKRRSRKPIVLPAR